MPAPPKRLITKGQLSSVNNMLSSRTLSSFELAQAIAPCPIVVTPNALMSEVWEQMVALKYSNPIGGPVGNAIFVVEQKCVLGWLSIEQIVREKVRRITQISPDQQVADVMVRSPIGLSQTLLTRLRLPLTYLNELPIDCLPILDADHHLIGQLSYSSLQASLPSGELSSACTAADVAEPVITTTLPPSWIDAARLLLAHPSTGIVIESKRQPVGYLTLWDLFVSEDRLVSAADVQPIVFVDATASLETVRSQMQQADRILLSSSEDALEWQWITSRSLLQMWQPSEQCRSPDVDGSLSSMRSPDQAEQMQAECEKRQSVELRLQQSEQFYRMLLSQISDAVFLTDQSGTFQFICPNADVIFGYSHDEIAAMQSIRRLLGDEIVDRAQQLCAAAVLGDGVSRRHELTNIEQCIRDQNGNSHTVLINAKRIWIETEWLLYTVRDITDRKQMERSLQSQAAGYQAVVDSLPVGLCIYTSDGAIVHCNSQACALLSLSENYHYATDGSNYWRDEAGRVITADRHPLNRVLSTQQPVQNSILSIQSPSQSVPIWLSVDAFLLDHQLGHGLSREWSCESSHTSELQYVVVIFKDISDRIRNERELAKSEEQFRQLANHLPELVWIYDEAGEQILFVSQQYEQFWGQSREALYIDPDQWFEQIHPDDRARVQQRFTSDLRIGHYDQEYRICLADGSVRWMRDRGFPIYDDSGVIFRTAGFTQDITDQKQSELSLRRLNQALESRVEQRTADLHRSEQRFRRFFEQSIVGMAIVSPNQIWLEVNDCFCALLGYSAEELIEQGWTGVTHPDDAIIEQVSIDQILSGERDGYCIDKRFIHRLGYDIQVIISTGCVRNPDGTVEYLAQMVLDISDRKRAEAALRQREQRYRNLFENAPISLWEEDFSEVKTYLDDLCDREHITDLDAYLQQHPQAVTDCADRVRVLDVNQATVNLLHGSDKPRFLTRLRSLMGAKSLYGFRQELVAFYNGHVNCTVENVIYDFQGQERSAILQLFIDPDSIQTWSRVLVAIMDISDRKQMEEALRRSETRLAEAQRVAHVGSWEFDTQTQTATWSAEVCRIFGLDPGQRHPSFDEIRQQIHLDDVWRWEHNVHQCLETGCLHYCEFRVVQPDGTVRYVESRGEPSFNDQGQVTSLFGIVLDLTERKQTELALRRSEATQNAIIHAIPDLLVRVDRDGNKQAVFNADRYENFIDVNSSAAATLSGVFPEHIVRQQLQYIQKALETRELQIFEYEIQIRGQIRYEELRIVPCGIEEVLMISRDITDRRRAESALRDREEFLRSIYDGIDVGIFVVDIEADGVLRYAGFNPTHERLLNASAATLIGRTPDEILNPESAQKVMERYHTCLRQGDRLRYEEQLTFDQQPSWWLTTLTPLRQSNGQIHRIIGTTLNITDSKRRENALRLIVEATASTTGSAFFSACTRALAEVLDVSCAVVAEFRGQRSHPLSLWRDGTWHLMDHYSLSGTPCESVLTGQVCYFPDSLPDLFPDALTVQRWQLVSYCGIPVFNASGQVIGHLSVMDCHPMDADLVRDSVMQIFAARVGAELERQQAEQALQREVRRSHLLSEITQQIRSNLEAQHIYQTTVTLLGTAFQVSRCVLHDYIPEPFNRLKPVAEWLSADAPSVQDTEILLANNPHARQLIAQDHAIVTSNVANDPLLTEVLPCCERFNIQAIMAVQTSYRGQSNGTISLHQCDRCREWTHGEINLLEAVAAQVGIAIAQAKLLEQEQHRRQELGHINAELARATRLKDEFLASMSHELRTPLNAILGLSEGLQEQIFGELSERQQQAIATIYSSSQHLLSLINDILDLAKVESGKMQLERSLVDIHYLCDSSLIFIRQQAIRKQIQLHLSIPDDLPAIAIDERRIRQVLINLLNNAVKFTPDGGRVELSVTAIGAADRKAVLCFTVSDTGIGIAAEQQDQLFKPFVQLDSRLNREYAGTGLGLALVRQLTELHGGTVSLVSELGQGSQFTVRLPYVTQVQTTAIAPDAQLNASSRMTHSIDPSNSPPTAPTPPQVLIVQSIALMPVSNQILLSNLTQMLNQAGCVTVLTHSDEVLPLATTLQPALILLDFDGFGEDTWTILASLMEHPPTQDVPTAVIASADMGAIASANGITVLTKPVQPQQVSQLLENLCICIENNVSGSSRAQPFNASPPAAHRDERAALPMSPIDTDSRLSGQSDDPAGANFRLLVSQSSAPLLSPLILLAEDNEANLATLVNYLELQGYRMIVARTGLEAVTIMEQCHADQQQPDLVLMDIQMPEMDGLTAIRLIRQMPNCDNLPIIALTALAMPGDRQRCFAAGATGHVTKPFRMRQLREMIHTMLSEG